MAYLLSVVVTAGTFIAASSISVLSPPSAASTSTPSVALADPLTPRGLRKIKVYCKSLIKNLHHHGKEYLLWFTNKLNQKVKMHA